MMFTAQFLLTSSVLLFTINSNVVFASQSIIAAPNCLSNLLRWYKTLITLRFNPPTLNLKSDEEIPCDVIGRTLSLISDDDARRVIRHVSSRIPKIQELSFWTWLLHVLWHHPMTSPVHMGIGCIPGVIPATVTHGKLEVMCTTHPCNGHYSCCYPLSTTRPSITLCYEIWTCYLFALATKKSWVAMTLC